MEKVVFFDNLLYVPVFFFLNDRHGFVGVFFKREGGKLEPDETAQSISEVNLSVILI